MRTQAAILLAHAVFTQAITFVLRPTMTYRALELEVPGAVLGALAASFAIAPLVLALPSGRLVDRIGERRVMLGGALVLTLSSLAFLTLGGTVAGLLAASMLLGTGHLGCVVGQQALVANTSGPGSGRPGKDAAGKDAAGRDPSGTGARRSYDSAFGYYTFAASLGQAAGPGIMALFGGAQAIPDTTAIFAASGALSGVLVLLSVVLRSSGNAKAGRARGQGGVRSLLRLPGLPHALLTSCVVIAALDITLAYLPALGTERGLSSGTVGALLTVRGLASMGSRFFLGRLTSAFGRRAVLVACTTGAALGLALVAVPLPVGVVGGLLIVVGFGLGAGQPLTMSWLAESTPPGLRGRAMSLRLAGNRTGQIVIPSAAGLLAAGAGAGGVLLAIAVCLGCAGVAARRLPPSPGS